MLRDGERGCCLKGIDGLEHLLDLIAFMRDFPIDMSAYDRWHEKRWPTIEGELQEHLNCSGLAGFIDEYAESLAEDLRRMLECCTGPEIPEAAAAFLESLAAQVGYAVVRAQERQPIAEHTAMTEPLLPGMPEMGYLLAA